MTKPVEYLFYRVTRTEETLPSVSPVPLGLPGLDVRRFPRLKEVHPFFEEELWFEVGQTREIPLTDHLVRDLTGRKWQVEPRDNSKGRDDEERRLLAFCEKRHAELETAQKRVYACTLPRTDYYRAGLVGRHLKLADIGDDMERLKASGIVSEEVANVMIGVANRFSELRSDLESKGWRFEKEGTIWEPSSGGRPARYPRRVIRAHYRQLALQHMASASDDTIVELIQSDLKPLFGDLAYDEVREAIKYERKRESASTNSTPPVPEATV